MTLLLLACLGLQDADALIRGLSSDDIEARESAAAELIKLGAPALAPMKRALAAAEGERKARLQELIVKIEREERRKGFKGGDEVCGLAGALRSEKDEFRVGDAITLKLEIMNISREARAYVPARYFDREFPGDMSHNSGSYGKIVVKQTAGERPKECGGEIG